MGPEVPDRGDLVWASFVPQLGREQAGRRPALVDTPAADNGKVGLAVACPITSQRKGFPFEVALPPNLPISGVVLSDHLKSLDWRARRFEVVGRAPKETVDAVIETIEWLLEG